MQSPTTAWNEIFERDGKVFTQPHQDMPMIVQFLQGRQAATVLDLGSGSGRHVVYLAQKGFSVFGLDNSPKGIELTQQWLEEEGLSAPLKLYDMTQPLEYNDCFFDAVISIQVIHHARLATIQQVLEEIRRVLKPGGLVFITVPKGSNQGRASQEIEPHTFVPLDGPEKGLPHHIFTPEELRQVLADFEVMDIHLDSTNHYCLSALKQEK